MKYLVLLNLLFWILYGCLSAQTKAELEEKRNATLNEITYVDNMLKSTAKKKEESMNAVKIIGNKLNLRESVIRGMRDEINLLSERIDLNNLAINMMESDLKGLKNDYARAVINSYKSQKENPEIVYILSAKDFNQGYKRVKYLQQVTKFRRREAEIIMELRDQIQSTKDRSKRSFKIIGSEIKRRAAKKPFTDRTAKEAENGQIFKQERKTAAEGTGGKEKNCRED